MAETTNKRNKVSQANESVQIETGAIEEDLEGFTPEEIALMLKVKEQIAAGHYTDITPEHRKLLFVQWMIEHDIIGS
jgi:hypothetical protein